MVEKPCAHLLLRGKGKAFVGERGLGGWLCGYLLWGSSCRRLQYRIYSVDSLARLVADLRLQRPKFSRRISTFLTWDSRSHMAVKHLINWLSQLH